MSPIAFYAYLSNTVLLTEGSTVVFDQTSFNIANGYNNGNGSFTAPQSGYFFFTLFFQTYGNTDSDLAIFINDNILCSADGARNYDSAGCTAVAQLNQGDVAKVKVGGGNAHIFRGDMLRSTGFTGFLYHAL